MKKGLLSILLTLCLALVLLPASVMAAESTLIDGWYNLRCMSNYLNITSDGKAELRMLPENQAFYVSNVSDGKITLKMKDGRYLGLEGERKDGARVAAVRQPYVWRVIWEGRSEIFSLRPPEYMSKVLNASEQKRKDGTPIIIWRHDGSHGGSYGEFNAPENAEFRFIPVTKINDPTGESYRSFEKNNLFGYKDFTGNVVIPAQFDRAIEFSQGLALVSLPNKSEYGFINTKGVAVTPYKYDITGTGRGASDGRIRVCTKIYSAAMQKALDSGDSIDYTDNRSGTGVIVMKSGKKFPESDIVYKFGFINTQGQEVIKPQFDEVNDFHDGMAAVYKLQRKVDGMNYYKIGWINTAGKLVIPYQSEEYIWYANNVHDFEDGFVCYFKHNSAGFGVMPAGGIMDKTGKVIIPAEMGAFISDSDFGLNWKGGIIAVSQWRKANANGRQEANGKYWWPRLQLYDYAGRLIASPANYTNGYPIGGGYTLARCQIPVEGTMDFLTYWSVLDCKGKIVVARTDEDNYHVLESPYGYENGYVFYSETRVKVNDVP